jgi:hypothetical protein
VVDVPEVQVHPFLEGNFVSATHLPNAGEARHNGQPTKLPWLVLSDFLGHRRPGADERHVVTENVDELRKLIDAESPQNFPEWRDARVIAHLEDGPALLVLSSAFCSVSAPGTIERNFRMWKRRPCWPTRS